MVRKRRTASLPYLLAAALQLTAASLLFSSLATAQSAEEWNDPRTLALVRRAIERRSVEVVDSALQTYTAEGRGYVYFLLDAPEQDRQSLVRTDQVAVEVHWRAPNEGRQRIVGLREQKELPVTRLYYYLDRLTVVQDNYGQSIVIADGDNVNDVPHPVGTTGEDHYDYRHVDSLTLVLPGVDGPVRVHEIEVRPKNPDEPAIIGSIFLEAASAALVRMTFTFTPSSYIDPRLDFINVALENGLWAGRYWLPYEQRLEIRREIPELDLPFGTVIRTRMRVGNYRFNEEVPIWLFLSPNRITMAPREEREAFPFEQPIDAEWRLEGFDRPPDVEEIRSVARSVLRQRAVSGLPRGRLSIGRASDVFRYNRAEGATVGLGLSVRPVTGLTGRLHGGWAFGAEHPLAEVTLATGIRTRAELQGFVNRRGEVGGLEATSGAVNTLGSLLFATDYFDPFYTSGARASVVTRLGAGWTAEGFAAIERQRSASATAGYSVFRPGDGFRAVREIDVGDRGSLGLRLRRDMDSPAGGWWLDGTISGARHDSGDDRFDFARGDVRIGATWTRSERRAQLDIEARLGATLGDIPRQDLYLIGGRGTLPGFEYRSLTGDRVALGRVAVSADVQRPWLRGKLFGGVGWVDLGDGARAAEAWGVTRTGVRGTVGAGLGIFYDLLQVEVSRGIGPRARTQLIIEAQPSFWGFL